MILENENYIQSTELLKYNIIHLYTKKPFNFNSKAEQIKQEENLQELEKLLNHKFDKIIRPIQTHSANVKIITENNINESLEDTDAVITNLKNIALVTISADCQNIILYDKQKEVIANIHSGWKGTLNKILAKTLNMMKNYYDTNPTDIISFISPSIMDCCFEVDEDLANEFKTKFSNIDHLIKKGIIKDNKQKYFIDTINLNIKELKEFGVLNENIITTNICTKCNNKYYHSYREEKDKAGRNCCLISLGK